MWKQRRNLKALKRRKTMAGKHFKEKHAIEAFQIWSILAWAAENRQTMTYKDLSGATGIHWRNLRTPLAIIKHYCARKRQYCHLTVLVVDKDTGKPNDGLDTVPGNNFDKARETVFKLAKKTQKDKKDWKKQLQNPGLKAFCNLAKSLNQKNIVS